jgi:hypothetical protein
MKVGEIWICNNNCCFGEEREAPHYAKILGFIPYDIIQYCLIDITNGELEPMVTGLLDEETGESIIHYDVLPRTEFLEFYDKLRDEY